jgi:hypothetical protein
MKANNRTSNYALSEIKFLRITKQKGIHMIEEETTGQPETAGTQPANLQDAAAFWMKAALYFAGGKGTGKRFHGVSLDDAASVTEQMISELEPA